MLELGLDEVREYARKLAAANAEAEPTITDVYWFPSGDEIRLVELDSDAIPNDCIAPFYFPEDPEEGIPMPSGIALIRPEDKDRLSPPDHWGSWDDAEKVWSRAGG